MRQSRPIGILISNLGTPDAPTTPALRRYLAEFLWDKRVIDLWRPLWWLILHGIVLRTRPSKSAALYKSVWTAEGSPLLSMTRRQAAMIEAALGSAENAHGGEPLHFAVGMRYGNPSIASALQRLRDKGCERLLVLPLYPQYAAATVASSFDAVFDELKQWRALPELRLVNSYHDEPLYIDALVESIRNVWQRDGEPERLLFSFHGLPERYVKLGDPYRRECLRTTELVVRALNLNPARFTVAFQSRFGKEVWLQPYTDKTLEAWAKAGVKSVDVICPGFSADCLETIEEINMQNRELFLHSGGERFRYIPALNDTPSHIRALSELVRKNLQGWLLTD